MRTHLLHALTLPRQLFNTVLAAVAVVVTLASAGFATCASAQAPVSISLSQSAAAGQRVEIPSILQTGGDRLQLAVRSGTVYVKALTLHYAASRTSPVATDMPIRRLVISGDTIATLPLLADGRRLVAFTIASDPNSIAIDTTLTFRADFANDSTRSISPGNNITKSDQQVSPKRQQDHWTLVGSARVEAASDRHAVPVGRDKGPIERLKISARGGVAAITKIRLVLLSGDPIELAATSTLSAVNAPLEVRLEAPDTIREVVVFGDPRRPADRGTIFEIRAIPKEGWAGADGENRLKTGGWILLGTVTLNSVYRERTDRSNFSVPGAEGTFQRLRLVSRRQAVTMLTVTLDVGDGKPLVLPVNATLRPEAAGHQVALPTTRLPITSVKLEPVIRFRQSIDADIEVWAQY